MKRQMSALEIVVSSAARGSIWGFGLKIGLRVEVEARRVDSLGVHFREKGKPPLE